MEMPFFVYLLACADHSLYCGYTVDLKKRLALHRAGRGAKYTRGRLPVKMVYSQKFALRRDALRREYVLKQFSRKQKMELVKRNHLVFE